MVAVNSQKATGPAVGLYPHNMHPGLVPGIGVEDQRNTFGLDKITFFTTAVFVVAFIIWGISSPDSVSAASSAAFSWAITNAGWLLNVTMMMAIVTMAYIGFSRLGRIKLGTDDEEPEFGWFSWVAMMFGSRDTDGRGAGSDFDSSAHRYTDWYQRTDEEGENVDYDFKTDTWSDGYDPNSEHKEK